MSRSQIAAQLGGKDPAFFRQADGGRASATFRKNLDDVDGSYNTERRGLPGLSRDSTVEPETEESSLRDSMRSTSPSRMSSTRDSSDWRNTVSSTSTAARSPLPSFASQRFAPPDLDTSSSTQNAEPSTPSRLAMSPSQGRISPERIDRTDRPASPTKGLGGFVQSAMLKREGSVNKRWSAQASPGLSRGNSGLGGSRDSSGSSTGNNRMSSPPSPTKLERDLKPSALSRESTPAEERPGSSRSNTTVTTNDNQANRVFSPPDSGFKAPLLNTSANVNTPEKTQHLDITPPSSPTKTADSRRWSPTKSSWLESALSKSPERPAQKAAPPQQPSWMIDRQKKKESVDLGSSRPASFKEVNTGGLMRAPPMGAVTSPGNTGTMSPIGFNSVASRNSRADSKTSIDSLTKAFSPPINPKPSSFSSNTRDSVSSTKSSTSISGSNKGAQTPTPEETSNPMEAMVMGSRPTSTATASTGSRPNSAATPTGSRPTSAATPPKPVAPAKKEGFDFRAGLKSRPPPGPKKDDQPEFKNALGKLRSARTQNYVAPDTLKSNILMGKGALAVTGGPKKTERVDEFKESILAKKSDFQQKKAEGKAVEVGTPGRNPSAKLESTTPEALARVKSIKEKAKIALPPNESSKETVVPSKIEEKGPGAKLAGRFNPGLAGMLARGPPPMANKAGSAVASQTSKDDDGKESGIAPDAPSEVKLEHKTKSRARGPKRRAPATANVTPVVEESAPLPTLTRKASPDVPRKSSPEITRKPSPPVETQAVSPESAKPVPSDSKVLTDVGNNNDRLPSTPSKPASKPETISPKPRVESPRTSSIVKPTITSPKTSSIPKPTIPSPKPIFTPPKPAEELKTIEAPVDSADWPISSKPFPNELPPRSSSFAGRGPRPLPSKAPLPTRDSQSGFAPISPPRSKPERLQLESSSYSGRRPIDQDKDIEEGEAPAVSVKNAASRWTQSESNERTKPKSPIKLPTMADEEKIHEEAGLRSASGTVGLGLQSVPLSNGPSVIPDFSRKLPSPPGSSSRPSATAGIMSPPITKPSSSINREASNASASASIKSPKVIPPESPVPQTSASAKLFEDFFGDFPGVSKKSNIDTQSILASRPDTSEKIKTLRKQIWEVTGDGKSEQVPANREHVLFEDNIYLCTHVFGAANGTRTTEVYLWAGDNVSASAVEDAQFFSRKAAKDSNGKLIILHQGHESANFFLALGGIVITRRGSSARFNEKRPYMLCGRQHMGQIAFDEVEMNTANLCSGFPYIVSSGDEKLFIWKGKGSSADELGCARLIGMDLGLTGEFEEVEEGHEPAAFLSLFSDKSIPKSADHWKLKAKHDAYATRLFCVEQEADRPPPSPSKKVSFPSSPLASFFSRSYLSSPSASPSPEKNRGSGSEDTNGLNEYAANLGGRSPMFNAEDAESGFTGNGGRGPTMIVKVREISPFCQRDLDTKHIYVLDAFFEIYM
jgi:Domain of unknown function (DUF4045)